jgi:hypothetical protein
MTSPRLFTVSFLSLLFTAALPAQDGERVNVPLHDPSRPAHIRVHLINGGVSVRGADVKEITVESRASSGGGGRTTRHQRSESPHDGKADGLKRLDLPNNSSLDIEENNNVVNIKTSPWGNGADLVITVPRRSSLQLKALNNGDISVENVEGEIDADDLNGKVTLRNVSGSVIAHSLNGNVLATLDRIDAAKPMSFSTLNGDIDVTLPDSLRANVRMKTDNGEIYSDFDVKLSGNGSTMDKESGRQPDGRYRVRFDRSLRGAINGGGPEYQFTSFNGRIFIRRKK